MTDTAASVFPLLALAASPDLGAAAVYPDLGAAEASPGLGADPTWPGFMAAVHTLPASHLAGRNLLVISVTDLATVKCPCVPKWIEYKISE